MASRSMTSRWLPVASLLLMTASVGVLSGCGSETAPATAESETSQTPEYDSGPATDATATAATPATPSDTPRRSYAPVRLGGDSGSSGGHDHVGHDHGESSTSVNSVMAALRPLQVVIGQWEGKTRKPVDGFSVVDTSHWVWDLKTDRKQPALAWSSDKSPYFRKARLTYLVDEQKYQMTATDVDGGERVYEGTFVAEPEDVPGDDKKMQRTFKLQLTQVKPEDDRKLAQVLFNQQHNHRYLMEVYDRRGSRMLLFDTVASQRDGTNFAISDSDYGERTCIVSQGLGTTAVSHEGKTYYVCCSGCEAAFKDDPEKWIAMAAEREKEKDN